jgi:TfoX/Sxy family transcriptional regulator of competence genes
MTPYEKAAAELAAERPDIETGRMFGSQGLKIGGKTFAMLSKGRLVEKLPAARVNELVEKGEAERFDPGHGRLMKEWANVEPAGDTCLDLMTEALAYVVRIQGTGRA